MPLVQGDILLNQPIAALAITIYNFNQPDISFVKNTGQLDVLTTALLLKVWSAMEKIQRAGGARQLGISNCYDTNVIRSLYADANVKPAVLQNRFYQQTGYDADLRHWCHNHGVIYQSFWTLTANPHILSSNTIRIISQKYKKTQVQIFFRYLSQSGIVPLTGTSSDQHMREDLSVFDFKLSSEELKDVSLLLN